MDGCTDTSRSVRTSIASRRARCSAGEKMPVITSSAPAPNQAWTCSAWWSAASTVTGTMAVKASQLEPADQVDARGRRVPLPSTNSRQGCPRRTIASTSSGWLNTSSGNALAAAHCRTRAGTGHASGEKKRIVGRVRTHCLS